MPKLFIKNQKTKEENTYDQPQERILFGRTNTCDIELPHRSVSRRHAEITRIDHSFFLKDLKSGNGTFLNNKRLKPEEKHLLRSGDLIKIEDYEIRFILSDEEGIQTHEENTDTDILEIKLIKKMMKALEKDDTPSLEVLNGAYSGKKFPIPEANQEMIMGRSNQCDITIPENALSRAHAKLEKKWGGVVLSDLNSKNGTFINREAIKEKALHDGDRIMLGTIKLLYRNPKEISLQIAHQEAQRKKKEAAIQQAALLAKKQAEEARIAKEKAEQERRQKEEEAKKLEEELARQKEEEEANKKAEEEAKRLEKERQAEKAKAEEEARKQAEEDARKEEEAKRNLPVPASPQKSIPTGKGKLSLTEKILISVGILIGVTAIVAIISLFLS